MCQKKRSLYVFAAISWVCGLSSSARATCIEPDPGPLWTYPADGATDIALDADLLVMRPSYWKEAELTLDGEPLQRGDTLFESYDLGSLEPRTTYTISITVDLEGSSDAGPHTSTLEFTTGESATEEGTLPPRIASLETGGTASLDELPCQELLYMDTCFDTGPPSVLQLTTATASESVVLWQIESISRDGTAGTASRFLPASCGAPTALGLGFGGYVLHAVLPNGETLASEVFEKEILPRNASTSTSGCGAVPYSTPSLAWLALVGVLVLGRATAGGRSARRR